MLGKLSNAIDPLERVKQLLTPPSTFSRYIIDFVRVVSNMASTTQVEFEAVEIIPDETARVQALGEGSDDEEDEVTAEPKPEPSLTAPDASKVNVVPLAAVAAAVSAFMTLVAASVLAMRQRRRNTLAAADTDRAIKQGNALDATVTDETASHGSSRTKTNTSEFGAEDMDTTSWYE